ncbi:MAG: glycosyltransferase family 2 protein [Chitinophagaceae bacterium]
MAPNIIFWLSLLILFHSYLGYALIAYAGAGLRKTTLMVDNVSINVVPEVALVIPAFNEINCLPDKIENCLGLDYDKNKLIIYFVTDGSNDGSAEFISKYPQLQLFHATERKGKTAAINHAMRIITQEIVIFSDANTLLNSSAIKEIVKHYQDETVGGVAGEKKVGNAQKDKAVNVGEGLYWKYESWLKRVDSKFYSVVGAAGELFSLRRSLYRQMPEDIILDDFFMSLRLCIDGYVIRYEPEAFAMEKASVSISEERKRKVRISAGGFQAMGRLTPLLNFFKYPSLSYLYISHRVLRWTICPLLLPILLMSNCFLVSDSIVYQVALTVQMLFYFFALIGGILASRAIRIKVLFLPFYFLFMNWSLVSGMFNFIFLKSSVLWEKSERGT